MLTIRLRTRDGTERLSISACSTVAALRDKVSEQVERPPSQFVLSTDQAVLLSKNPETFLDLSEDHETLQNLHFGNGQWVYCWYEGAREVSPGYKRSKFDQLPFGKHMDVSTLMARQVRIERQDNATIEAVSFDRFAAHAFQSYIQAALDFSVQRCGLLFGRLEGGTELATSEGTQSSTEGATVFVDAIYEPAQAGKAERCEVDFEDAEARQAEAVAGSLGLRPVGLVFNQSAGEREYIVNDAELALAAALAARVGDHCVVAVFSQLEEDGEKEIHLEAFQCSKQAVQLWKGGWFQQPAADEVSGYSHFKHPTDPAIKEPVMISGKDTDEVDNDFFLVPVAVRDHASELLLSFPIENRLTGQASNELKAHLSKHSSKPYEQRLRDYHCLLWLAKQFHWSDADIAAVAESVRAGRPLLEGYKVMIDSMAGL